MPSAGVVEIPCGHGRFAVKAYLVLGARPILVDTGVPGSADKILSAMRLHALLPRDIALIVLTHGHVDHSGSARELRELTGAPVAIHRADAQYVRSGTSAPVMGRNVVGRLLARYVKRADEASVPADNGVEPDIIIDGDLSLAPWGIAGRIVHSPGHTLGSVSVVLDGGEAIVGDLMGGSVVRGGLPTPGIFAVDEDALQASIRRIVGDRPSFTYASHCSAFSLAQLQRAFG